MSPTRRGVEGPDPRIAIIGHYHEHLRSTALPLARAIRECEDWTGQPRLDAEIFVDRDDAVMRRHCDQAGVAINVCDHGWGRLLWHCILRKEGYQFPRRTSLDFAMRRRLLARVDLLRRRNVRLLVLADDRTTATMRWIGAARQLRIPTLLVQWAAVHKADAIVKLREQRSGEFVTTIHDKRTEQIASDVPQASVRIGDQRIWYLPPGDCRRWHRYGLFPNSNAFAFASGRSEAKALFGPAWKDRIVADGVPANSLHLSGHPDQDRWHALSQVCPEDCKRALQSQVRIDAARPWITVVAPAIRFRDAGNSRSGEVTAEQLIADLRETAVRLADRFPGHQIIVKKHPRDEQTRLQPLANVHQRVCIAGDVSTEQLIRGSCLMLCQWSTAALQAIALDTPLLLFDYHASASASIYQGILDVPVAADPKGLIAVAQSLVEDADFRASAIRDQARQKQRSLCCDGRATQRLIELMNDLMVAGSEPQSGQPRVQRIS